MTISPRELAAASAGPVAHAGSPYAMLSVGDSLMWGQGLRPENRFRELVRQRLSAELGAPVAELAMGRSGAVLHPGRGTEKDDRDARVAASLFSHPSPPVEERYRPDLFSREVPDDSLSTLQQLATARRLIQEHFGDAGPSAVRWILLDGGINDVGLDGFLAPFRAWSEGHFLSGWNSWIVKEAQRIRPAMEDVLDQALGFFPQADIVVNGYFPIFSYWSVGNLTRLQSVGLIQNAVTLQGLSNLVLANPWGLDQLVSVSTAWQVASTHEIKGAISAVRRRRPDRTVAFARSNIEGSRCLFSPLSWLWGYDSFPDRVPDNADEWLQLLLAATPEDEVTRERIPRCNELTTGFSGFSCRLASIGHPNQGGALDYATSIIEALEEAGSLRATVGECSLAARRRSTQCEDLGDEARFTCLEAETSVGKACSEATGALADGAAAQFQGAGDQMARAGESLQDAARCLEDATGAAGKAAAAQFSAAGDNFEAAGEQLAAVPECFDRSAARLQACSDTEASEIAECNAAFARRRDNECAIQCNSFTNCSSFSKINPARYACFTARGVCVAAAAAASAACLVGITAIREACKTAAFAKKAVCKAGVVAGDVVCAVAEGAKAAVEVAAGVGHVVLGGLASLGAIGSGILCAFGQVGVAIGHTLGAGIRVAVGIGLGIAALGVLVGCFVGQWVMNRSCRFGVWLGGLGCNVGSVIIHLGCFITTPIRAVGNMMPASKKG